MEEKNLRCSKTDTSTVIIPPSKLTSLSLSLSLQLNERGQVRLGQIDDAAEKVQEFYGLVAELQGMLGRAEEGLIAQGLVGTEVEIIKQQLQEFKVGSRVCACVCARGRVKMTL